jgi:glucose-6-phosphate 1-dehydrogenase
MGGAEPNQVVVRLDPSTGIRMRLNARRADVERIAPINLDMTFAEEGGEGPTPYEVLLHAAMNGVDIRFSRQDAVEETWRVMQPLLDAPPPVETYQPGTWGPPSAERLLEGFGTWHPVWLPR